MKRSSPLWGSVSVLIGVVIAILALVRGAWLVPLLLLVFTAWGLWVVIFQLQPAWDSIRGYPDNYEILSTDAALRAERIACRLRHLIYSSTSIQKGEYLQSASVAQGISIAYENGVLEVTLPGLLPKRRQRQSSEFLLDPLYFALEQYAKEQPLPHYRNCVVCFAQVYDQTLPTRRVRDYDNLEEKQLLDLLSTFVMADDTGLLCDAYNTTELGEQDCTKIFVMEKKRFPQWLAERKESLKTISDF